MEISRLPSHLPPLQKWLSSISRDTAIETVYDGEVSIGTTTGNKRKQNEDRACFVRLTSPRFSAEPIYLSLLCDGLGGMEAGAECATLASSIIISRFAQLIRFREIKTSFLEAIESANQEVFARYGGNGGTTLVAVVSTSNLITGVSVGDSRLYGIERGNRIVQLSVDDTVASEVRQVAAISASKLKDLEFGEQLTQFVGIGPEIRLKELPSNALSRCERFVLLSDGAWRSSNGVFLKLILNGSNSSEIVRRIINVSNWCGGIDNTTVLVSPSSLRQTTDFLVQYEQELGTRIDVWSPFGQLSVIADESTHEQSTWKREDRVISRSSNEITPRQKYLATPVVAADHDEQPTTGDLIPQTHLQSERVRSSSAGRYTDRGFEQGTGANLSQKENKKIANPRQLEIVVHDDANSSKKVKQQKTAQKKGAKGDGNFISKKGKRPK